MSLAAVMQEISEYTEATNLTAYLKSLKRGKFIVFDGPDGSGKTSMVDITATFLRRKNIPLKLMKSPGGTLLGTWIRKLMFDETVVGLKNMTPDAAQALFLAAHMQASHEAAQWLEEGYWVLSDRWTTSFRPYAGYAGVSEHMQWVYESFVNELPWDILFYLTGDPATLLSRARARTTETHQDAKPWNTLEGAMVIKASYDKLLLPDPRTYPIDTTTKCPMECFCSIVEPAINILQ